MTIMRKTITATFAVAMCSAVHQAGAVCDQTGASTADNDLWNTHGCWQEFFLWQAQAYDLRGGDWSGRGWNDACNIVLEYPKHWNASYLLNFGLADDPVQSFHGTSTTARPRRPLLATIITRSTTASAMTPASLDPTAAAP